MGRSRSRSVCAAFRAKAASAFRLGREETAATAHLMSGRFMARNMVGMEDSTAFKAISEMRRHLDELDPGKEGDLLSQNKLLGMIPYGDKLKAYCRRFQSASQQLQTAMRQIYAARDDLQRRQMGGDAHSQSAPLPGDVSCSRMSSSSIVP